MAFWCEAVTSARRLEGLKNPSYTSAIISFLGSEWSASSPSPSQDQMQDIAARLTGQVRSASDHYHM